eukprot:4528388-Pleurochrysis_carterae.AAC.1
MHSSDSFEISLKSEHLMHSFPEQIIVVNDSDNILVLLATCALAQAATCVSVVTLNSHLPLRCYPAVD